MRYIILPLVAIIYLLWCIRSIREIIHQYNREKRFDLHMILTVDVGLLTTIWFFFHTIGLCMGILSLIIPFIVINW